jgi:hypothetical protein
MFTRRKFLVHSASTLALTLGAGRLAKAAVGGWAQQQGGSQDLQTGLVWLDFTNLSEDIATLPQTITNAASFPYLPYTNAYDDWRLPTLAEMNTAFSDGISMNDAQGLPNCPLGGTPGGKFLWWSSTTTGNGQKDYAIDLRTGISETVLIYTKTGKTISYNSMIYQMFVRQGT